MPYLSALEVCSRQGAIQMHVYLTLPYLIWFLYISGERNKQLRFGLRYCPVYVWFSVFTVDAWTIAFSSDSRFIASGSHTGKIILYGVESGQREVQLDTRGGKFALSIAYVSLTASHH